MKITTGYFSNPLSCNRQSRAHSAPAPVGCGPVWSHTPYHHQHIAVLYKPHQQFYTIHEKFSRVFYDHRHAPYIYIIICVAHNHLHICFEYCRQCLSLFSHSSDFVLFFCILSSLLLHLLFLPHILLATVSLVVWSVKQ